MSPGMLILGGILLAVVGFGALQLGIRRFASRNVGKPAPYLPGIDLSGSTVLWFHSPGCAPCRAMKPLIDGFVDHGSVLSIDVSVQPEVAMAFGILGTPSLVRVRNGQIDAVHTGAMSPGALDAFVAPTPALEP